MEGEPIWSAHRWGLQDAEPPWKPAKGYAEYPIIRVSWYGANLYCEWLSHKKGQNFRLPSEAEWEYAARGGNSAQGLMYAGSSKVKEVAWFDENSLGTTHPVGLKFPNELGLHDMNGNVWEWCADHWHDTYRGAPKDGNAWTSGGDSTRRVLRGGSWLNTALYCRVSARFRLYPLYRNLNVGFRVAGYPYP